MCVCACVRVCVSEGVRVKAAIVILRLILTQKSEKLKLRRNRHTHASVHEKIMLQNRQSVVSRLLIDPMTFSLTYKTFQFVARFMFYSSWFSLLNQSKFSSRSKSLNYFVKFFPIHSFSLQKINNWKCSVLKFIFINSFESLIRRNFSLPLIPRWFPLLIRHILCSFYFCSNKFEKKMLLISFKFFSNKLWTVIMNSLYTFLLVERRASTD